MKHACGDAGKCLKTSAEKAVDIEDIIRNSPVTVKLPSGQQWTKPISLDDALAVVRSLIDKGSTYRLVAGNTSTGTNTQCGILSNALRQKSQLRQQGFTKMSANIRHILI